MQQEEETSIETKCIFCDKILQKHEMVRYRRAISCIDCAVKQKNASNITMTPFYYFAGLGCLIGLTNFIYFTFHGLIFMPSNITSYVQPLVPYFAGMTTTLILISFGLYAISHDNLRIAGVIGMLTSLLAAATSALALFDYITTGPTYINEVVTYTKTLNYYPTTLATYSLLGLVAGIVILLHIADYKTENASIASAAFFFLSAFISMTTWTWIYAGFVHAFTYALAFVFFVTRKQPTEVESIQPL